MEMNNLCDSTGSGKVYFIQAVNGGPIKIGFTTNLYKRLNTLQTGFPYKLQVLYSICGDIMVERGLHEVLLEHALNGEWFEDVPAVHAQIENLENGIIPIATDSSLWSDRVSGAIIDKGISYTMLNDEHPLSDTIKNASDLLKTYILREYLIQDSNIIGDDGKPFDVSEIALLIGISEKHTKEYLSRMSKLGIIAKTKTDKQIHFAFNPIYGNACRNIPQSLCDLFGVSVGS